MKKALIPKWKEADMFWYGFIVGLFIGANLAVLVIGLLIAAKDEKPCTT